MVQMLKDKAEFDTTVSGNAGKLVVVDFTASWCPPCQMIAPKFAELATELEGTCVLVKVDVDENAEAAQACGISCMPTFQFFKDGVKIAEIQGADFEGIKAKINELK
jgi:thioredoxin